MMKKLETLINKIDYSYLEEFSYIILMFWAVSPIVEYVIKQFFPVLNKLYFSLIIYIIGILGFIEYLVYFWKQRKDGKLTKKKYLCEILLIILLFLGIISSLFSKNPRLSFLGESYRREGLIVYIMYIGFILISSIIKQEKYKKNLVGMIIISALIITILPLFRSDFSYMKFANIFYNSNHYGYFLMLSVILSANMFVDNDKIKQFFYFLAYIFLLYLLIRNDTFGCYLAVMISIVSLLIYSLIKKYHRLNVIIVFVSFILISFIVSHYDIKVGERLYFENTKGTIIHNINKLFSDVNDVISNKPKSEKSDSAGSNRGFLWRNAINYTLDHPIIGGGMECLNEYYHTLSIYHNDRPHNVLLEISAFIGIPGALVYLSLIIILAWNNLKNIKNNNINITIYFTAMCYFISSVFGNSMFYTSPYFMILLGLLISLYRENVNNSNI